MLSMIARSVGAPQIETDTPGNRRIALEEMCGLLCRHDTDAQAVLEKFDDLRDKYRESKRELRELRASCAELTHAIHRSRRQLAEHMEAMQRQEHSEIDEKLARLEEMVSSQIEEQKVLMAERNRTKFKSAKTRSDSVTREPLPPRPPPVTTEAVKRRGVKRTRK
jgi:septal ring factor EnvC (AmiA/AmiB activator)